MCNRIPVCSACHFHHNQVDKYKGAHHLRLCIVHSPSSHALLCCRDSQCNCHRRHLLRTKSWQPYYRCIQDAQGCNDHCQHLRSGQNCTRSHLCSLRCESYSCSHHQYTHYGIRTNESNGPCKYISHEPSNCAVEQKGYKLRGERRKNHMFATARGQPVCRGVR